MAAHDTLSNVVLWNSVVKLHPWKRVKKPGWELDVCHSKQQVLHPAAVQSASEKGSFGLERPAAFYQLLQGQQNKV